MPAVIAPRPRPHPAVFGAVVLSHWHVRRTEDFGRIVFAMIAEGLMSKTDDDTPEDFRAVYDFEEAFSSDQLSERLTADGAC